MMRRYTGTIILLLITLIFGVDTILSLGNNATISEVTHDWLRQDPLIGFTTLVGAFTALIAHFWWFRKKD